MISTKLRNFFKYPEEFLKNPKIGEISMRKEAKEGSCFEYYEKLANGLLRRQIATVGRMICQDLFKNAPVIYEQICKTCLTGRYYNCQWIDWRFDPFNSLPGYFQGIFEDYVGKLVKSAKKIKPKI